MTRLIIMKNLRSKVSEKDIQKAILAFLWKMGYPAFPVPNSGFFNPATRRYNIVDMSNHVKGVPDIVCPCPGGKTVYFEVKSETGCLSSEQIEYHTILRTKNHNIAVVRSVNEVIMSLTNWGLCGATRI